MLQPAELGPAVGGLFLNPETDLQEGDLRLQLIQHAKDPNAFARERKSSGTY